MVYTPHNDDIEEKKCNISGNSEKCTNSIVEYMQIGDKQVYHCDAVKYSQVTYF